MKKMKTNLSLEKKALPKKRRSGDRKTLRKDERAVSPVIGVILMIAITVVIAAVVASFAYGIIGGVAKAPNSALVVEDARVGNTDVIVIHHGGDTIVNAFTGTSTPSGWKNLMVKHNGVDVTWSDTNVTLGGDTNNNFASGEQLDINLTSLTGGTGLESGDTITVVYTVTGDLMQRVKVA